VTNQPIDISQVQNREQLYYASVDARDDGLYELGSRTVAVVGIADTLQQAEAIAEAEIQRLKGPLFHRRDIGTAELIERRVDEMRKIRKHSAL